MQYVYCLFFLNIHIFITFFGHHAIIFPPCYYTYSIFPYMEHASDLEQNVTEGHLDDGSLCLSWVAIVHHRCLLNDTLNI